MPLPLTPSDNPEYQRKNPIGADDTYIVMIDGDIHKSGYEKLREVFNKHKKGRVVTALQGTFWVKDINWDIVNELRERNDVSSCGPVSKGPIIL